MNIREAKEEIKRTVRAYLARDPETGERLIPSERQRPVLMIGAPGIGKTAVMRQIAEEMGIGLVSYTITHHTRQSAIGLPFIAKKTYGGEEHTVTEYTMSEIVASVYDQIERSGREEGILFLDEINCVSETLFPTMLQFLQYKTFGSHKVPAGYVIVTAGNPPEFNRSVRDFDIVTLDRVKKLEIEADYDVWKEYALGNGVHGAVISYLNIHKTHFSQVVNDADGRRFVTPRSWVDLSDSLRVYERIGETIGEDFVGSFLQDPEIARSFTIYYELWNRYRSVYHVPEILEGQIPDGSEALREAPFDEKLSLIGLLVSALNQAFTASEEALEAQRVVFALVKEARSLLTSGEMKSVSQALTSLVNRESEQLGKDEEAGRVSRAKARTTRLALARLKEMAKTCAAAGDGMADLKAAFTASEEARQAEDAHTGDMLTHAFSFMTRVFGEGQELVMFLSELSKGYYSMKFVDSHGNEAFYKYNKLLLLSDRRQGLRDELMEMV